MARDGMLCGFLIATIVSLVSGSAVFDSPGPQIQPGDYSYAINFQYGQTQTFRWTTNLTAVRLTLVQETTFIKDYAGTSQEILSSNNDRGSYDWSGYPSPRQNLDQGVVFFLLLFDAAVAISSAENIATSNYFNVTDIPVSSSSALGTASISTSASPVPTSTPSSSTLTSMSTSSSPTSMSTSSAGADPTSQSGSNEALPIGLGVGLGCAILLGLSVAGFFYRRHKKQQDKSAVAYWGQGSTGGGEGRWGGSSPGRSDDTWTQQPNNTSQLSPPVHQLHEKFSGNLRPLRTELQ